MSWLEEAACRGMDIEIFFPPSGVTANEAKAVCARCTVRAECLDDALSTREYHTSGIRGGLSPKERRGLKVALKVAS